MQFDFTLKGSNASKLTTKTLPFLAEVKVTDHGLHGGVPRSISLVWI